MNPTTQTPVYTTVEDVKALRVEVDALINKVQKLMFDSGTPFINAHMYPWKAQEQVFVHLIESKMWLGKCLEGMNNPFPAELADKAPVQ